MARTPDPSRLQQRVEALEAAADLSQGRVDDALVTEARRVVKQVDRRLATSGGATVVALAGATGSGKSSLFNAVSGTSLATTGVRRPTTSQALAATWGAESFDELLGWLQIPRRHAVAQPGLDGLVLLDLPDHDSTELAHRLEVDRLVQLVDVLVWVVDPQKYADAALHHRYLEPLARHAEVMLVVLNQADRLTPAQRDACLADLRRLLESEGLGRVEVLATSAETGAGVDGLRRRLARQVANRTAAARRLGADVTAAASALSEASGTAATVGIDRGDVDAMNAAIAEAAGVPVVTRAVRGAWRQRGAVATGWPLLAWAAKLRPDPLRRLHLDRLTGRRKELRGESDPTAVGRSSLPPTSGVQQARVDAALRTLADEAGRGLSRGWADAVKSATRRNAGVLADAVDTGIGATDLDLDRHRRWWQLVRVVQWLLIASVAVGLLWFGAAFLLAYLRMPPLPEVTWWSFPAPLVLAVGGVLAGLLLAGLSRVGVEVGARRREAEARRLLRRAIAGVTDAQVLVPLRTELDRYEQARSAIGRALTG